MMKTVLLIEDHSDIRENTRELLEMQGYKVIVAANGQIGLTLVKENKVDVILCDILMPVTGGFEVFHAIRNDSRTCKIPFVFLTASADKKEVEAGLGMGANGYIRKPFSDDELFSTIENCLILAANKK